MHLVLQKFIDPQAGFSVYRWQVGCGHQTLHIQIPNPSQTDAGVTDYLTTKTGNRLVRKR